MLLLQILTSFLMKKIIAKVCLMEMRRMNAISKKMRMQVRMMHIVKSCIRQMAHHFGNPVKKR
jgi:hypothetical protein